MKPSPRSQEIGFSSSVVFSCLAIILLLSAAPCLFGQAALLLEEPYGVFGTLNPTGHAAIYLERVCADTPVHLRLCNPGETGVVISRYKGMAGYDWVAIPLIPYLYAVEDPAQVPKEVDQETVNRLRNYYREASLGDFGRSLPPGNFLNGGWTELIGTAYDRRTYAFRFQTTIAQDEKLIARLSTEPNSSHFNILFNNCADFDRSILNSYFPHKFGRSVFPDLDITTPKQITYKVTKYAKRHPETSLTILEIPQVPGFRHKSQSTDGVAESLLKRGYVIPIVVLNPYIAGGLLADYLVRGRYPIIPKYPQMLSPEDLDALTQPQTPTQSQLLIEADTTLEFKPAEVQPKVQTLTRPSPQPDNPLVPVPSLVPVVSTSSSASDLVNQHPIQK